MQINSNEAEAALIAQSTPSIVSEDQQLLADIVTGYQNKSLSDLELARAIEELQTRGVSQKTIAQAFGLSGSWVWKHLTILTLEPEVLALMSLEAFEKSRLTYSNAVLLTDIVGHPELQISLAKEICQRRLSNTQARRLIKERADQAQVLLASDTELVEKEFRLLLDCAQTAEEKFKAMSGNPFRFRAMLDAYDVEDVRRLQESLAGCARNCAIMAKMAQEHLSAEEAGEK